MKLKSEIAAELDAAVCQQFLELTARPGVSARQAAMLLNKPIAFFCGSDSALSRWQRAGSAGLMRQPREVNAPNKFAVPQWFIPAAKFFFSLSNLRRDGGSVPEAVRRVISLPVLPCGWTGEHKNRLLKVIKLAALPACPPELRETILQRERFGKPLVPVRISQAIAVPDAIIQKIRSPRAFVLDNLCAPGSQRRFFNAETGQRQIMQPGDWVGADDATPGIAVCVPSNEILTPSSEKFGVLIGRFQWLVFIDCRTDRILAFDYVVRPRGSYRAEDILSGMATVCKTHGVPRRGFQFEGGTWQAKLVQQAVKLLRCEGWRTYSPHQKAVESIFNRVWTRLAVQFPHADMGRYRSENESNCRLYEACKRGNKDPRQYFPTVSVLVKAFEEEISAHNSKPIVSRQYGQWIPDDFFSRAVAENPLRKFSPSMNWIFSPYTVERQIHGQLVRCRVPMFEDFSIPFEFTAPWMPLHRGKKVRAHFNPRDPKCRAKIVLLENSGQHKPGDVLGDAELVGETAQHVRFILEIAQDNQRAGYLARQRTNNFMHRQTRGIGDFSRVTYSMDERRDGLGSLVKVERSAAPAGPAPARETFPAALPDLSVLSAARNGKIARLPATVRDEINSRLHDGHTAKKICAWVNNLAEAQRVMSDEFDGEKISEANVSNWRAGGFQEWLTRQTLKQEIANIAEFERKFPHLIY